MSTLHAASRSADASPSLVDVPSVDAARALAKRWGLDSIVILHVRGDRMGAVSYGRDMEVCADTAKLCDHLYEAAVDGQGKTWDHVR